jgi:hypothetical protein
MQCDAITILVPQGYGIVQMFCELRDIIYRIVVDYLKSFIMNDLYYG